MVSIRWRRRFVQVARAPLPTEIPGLVVHINPVYAELLRVFGPPDTPDNPLVGTKYDPRLALRRDHEKFKRRRTKSVARWQRWDARLRGHNPVPSPGWLEALEAADHDATPSRQPELPT